MDALRVLHGRSDYIGKASVVLGYAGGNFAEPDAAAIMHNSLNDTWLLLEPLFTATWI